MKKIDRYINRLLLGTGLVLLITFTAGAQNGQADTLRQAVAQRLSFITIGAKDLTKLRQFYVEKFNWVPLPGSNKGIAFFKMNGFILALYPSNDIAAGAGIVQDGQGFKRFSCTIYYSSVKEVDQVFTTLLSRGVHIIKPPKKASWGGYIGYVADIEDNIWEIGYNPYVPLDAAGNAITHL